MDSLRYALKEWAVAVKALECGETALVVRKGGIREKAFAVPKTRFLLLPGYEHQRPELLKDEYRHLMGGIPDLTDDGPLRFSNPKSSPPSIPITCGPRSTRRAASGGVPGNR